MTAPQSANGCTDGAVIFFASAGGCLQHPAIAFQLAPVGQDEMPRLDFAEFRKLLCIVVHARVIDQELFLCSTCGLGSGMAESSARV